MKQNLVVFIKPELLKHEESFVALRDYLSCNNSIEKYSKIDDVIDGHVLVTLPPIAFREAHQNDSGLCAYDYDAVYAGYFKATLESLISFMS